MAARLFYAEHFVAEVSKVKTGYWLCQFCPVNLDGKRERTKRNSM